VDDTAKLRALIERIRGLAHVAFRKTVSASIAKAATSEVRREFSTGRDPFDHPWARTKGRGATPLRGSGRLAGSFSPAVTPEGFTLRSNVAYARVHQRGKRIRPRRGKTLRFRVGNQWVAAKAVTIPARKILPTSRWGPRWSEGTRKAAALVLLAFMKRK